MNEPAEDEPARAVDRDLLVAQGILPSDGEELNYLQLEQMLNLQTSTFLSRAGLRSDEVESRELSGREALEWLREEREFVAMKEELAWLLDALLQREDARAFLLRGTPEHGVQIESLVVPFPEARLELGELGDAIVRWGGRGVMFFGQKVDLSACCGAAPDVSCGAAPAERSGREWPELTRETYEMLVATNASFVVFLFGEGCGPSQLLEQQLGALDSLGDDFPLYVVSGEHFLATEHRRLFRQLGAPALIAFEGEEWQDVRRGFSHCQEEQALRLFLAQNGFVAEEAAPFLDGSAFPDRRSMLVTLTVLKDWVGLNLSGEDLQGLRFVNAVISGSDFRGANFRHGSFRSALISHTRFGGADLEGADVEGAVLKNVECVDGRWHSGTAEGCLVD